VARVSRPTYLGGLGFGFKWNMGWMHDTLTYFQKDPVYRRFHHHTLDVLAHVRVQRELHPAAVARRGRPREALAARQDAGRPLAEVRQPFARSTRTCGRTPARSCSSWAASSPSGRSGIYDGSLHWNLLEYAEHQGVQSSSATSTAPTAHTRPLYEVDFDPRGFPLLEANDAANNVLAFARLDAKGEQPVVCVLNLSPVPRYELPRRHAALLPLEGAPEQRPPLLRRLGRGKPGRVEAEPMPWHDQAVLGAADAAAARGCVAGS